MRLLKKFEEEDGYFTIEAAIVGSMACFLVLFVMVAGIYFYDVGTATSYLYEEMAELSVQTDTIQTQSSNFYKATLTERLVTARILECKISTKSSYIVGQIRLSVAFPIPMVTEWMGKVWENKITVRMEQGMTADKIRRWTVLE